MAKKQDMKNKRFGLVGKNISYSFSRAYFSKKFLEEGLENYEYVNFDIPDISEFPEIISQNEHLAGMNVTIPYKEQVIPFLQSLHPKAKKIGAVNTIKITPKGLKGYNTDCYGFKKSLQPLLKPYHKKALILGTGGASKAVAFVLEELGIGYRYVSRKNSTKMLSYDILTKNIMEDHQVIINCTPLGTHPDIDNKPPIPYQFITKRHLLYDLIYNPSETAFMKAGKEKGAETCNGLRMLELQAEKAWKIWNS